MRAATFRIERDLYWAEIRIICGTACFSARYLLAPLIYIMCKIAAINRNPVIVYVYRVVIIVYLLKIWDLLSLSASLAIDKR